MNYKNYAFYLVVDEDCRPMTFHDSQFCYAETGNRRSPFAARLYTKETAEKLIKRTIEYRIKFNFPIGEYNLMPVGLKIKRNDRE